MKLVLVGASRPGPTRIAIATKARSSEPSAIRKWSRTAARVRKPSTGGNPCPIAASCTAADQRVDVVVFGDVCRVLNHDVGHAWLPSESTSATSSCRRCLTCVISQRNGIFKEVVASVRQQITTAERPERSEAASAKVTAERPERSEAASAKVTAERPERSEAASAKVTAR